VPRKAPVPDAPASWQQQSDNVTTRDVPPGQWWVYFQDASLDQLIDKGLRQNTDHRLALARIREARSLAQYAGRQLYPNVSAVASADRARTSGNLGSARAGTENVFSAGFDASWELDLFGRLRQQGIAANAEERAIIAESQAISLSLIAEISQQYTLYRQFENQAALANQNTVAQEGVLKVTEARYQQGVEGNLEVMRARTLLETTRAQIPFYENQAQTAAYQIDYLLGDKPGANKATLGDDKKIPVISQDIFMDVPLKIIQNRPDIMAAQQRVIEATALKRSTIAELYPDVSLSAALGLASGTLGSLAEGSSRTWSTGAGLLAPLFDFGRIRANINASKAREEQAEITFEQTVLAALRDIETAASSYIKAKERYTTLDKAASSSYQAVDIARKQYKEGILSQLDVLQAEQSAYEADISRAQAAAELTQDFIALCKALALTPDSGKSGK
jgi:NodT family efflux transporter outer membrane factor (OMF) lipoprotein